MIQAGAILAVCWEYRARSSRSCADSSRDAGAQRFAVNVVVAFVPAGGAGTRFRQGDQGALFAPVPVACAFVLGAFVILWAERRQRLRPDAVRIDSVDDMRWTDALKVGFAQALALIPGHVALGRDDHRRHAVRAVAHGGDRILVLPRDSDAVRGDRLRAAKKRQLLVAHDLPAFGVGFVAAFVSAFLCVRWLIRYVSHHDFVPFAWYRIAFGAVILATAYAGLVAWG